MSSFSFSYSVLSISPRAYRLFSIFNAESSLRYVPNSRTQATSCAFGLQSPKRRVSPRTREQGPRSQRRHAAKPYTIRKASARVGLFVSAANPPAVGDQSRSGWDAITAGRGLEFTAGEGMAMGRSTYYGSQQTALWSD